MLSVQGLKMAFGGRDLFGPSSFAIKPGQRVGLVGPNGCGKTTLMKIVAGLEVATAGEVSTGPEVTLGYLGQEGQLEADRTLYEEMAVIFAEVEQMEQELRQMEEQMGELEGAALEQILASYDRLQNRYQNAEPLTVDARIRTVLSGLGFAESDLERPCREFSGGWQMRGAMARLLLTEPDVMLLDEPTNHLDLAGVEWLEQHLVSGGATVLMVSHDRTFLDRVAGRILSFESEQIEDYAGNYSYFLEERQLRREQQAQAYKNQQKKIAAQEKFIERFRYKATLASRVQSREKTLAKMDRVEAPSSEGKAMKASFADGSRSGEECYKLKKVSKSFGDIKVLDEIDLLIRRDERIAIVGANGSGKSTLLKLLAGVEPADEGRLKSGYRLQPVYFAQHQAEALDESRTALEELEVVAPQGTTQTRLRTILGSLLFEGDDVFKKIEVLSGGERSRVALARCLVTPSNLLLLDEPTNHLDLVSREALLYSLQEYAGTLIMVTHDRHFMDGLAERVLEVHSGQVTSYLGNYSNYRDKKRRQADELAREAERRKAEEKKARKKMKPARRSSHTSSGWKLEALEKKIFGLEERLEELAALLADPDLYQDGERAAAVQQDYEGIQAEVAELTAIWEEIA